MKELEPYSVFAEIYDYSMRFVPYKEWSGYILHRYNHFQKSKPNSILDIGCGTGELLHYFSKELKQKGSLLMGLDQSQAMIQMAEEKSKKIQWIHSSIQDFESDVPFDLVVSTHTTINYFKNPAELFKYSRKLAKKGGLFFFDFTSEINLLNHFHKKKIQESQQNFFLEWNSNFDPSTQEIQVNLDFYHARTKAQIGREYHQQFFHKPANLEKDLKQNGFKILEKGGDYDLYSKYETSDMCHILCQKNKRLVGNMIRIQNLKKIYGNSVALDDVSFQCEKGKITGLLGPNGAGKTTTMRILAGFLKSSEGRVEYDGFDFNQDEIQIKKRLGYLPESAPLYADMIVQEYLEFMAQARGILSSKILISIHRVVDLCKLESHLYSPIHQLSKGFKQRVALAGTLIHDPDFIILDEPSSGLDPNQITIIRHLIQKLGKDKTIILSTHILQEVIEVCDQVVILSKGKVVLDREVGQLGLTERILFTTNENLESIQNIFSDHGLTDIQEIVSTNPELHSYTIDTMGKGGDFLFRILANHNLVASEIRPFARSLETIFSELTNKV